MSFYIFEGLFCNIFTKEALKFYGQNGDDILISDAIEHIAQFSMIHGDTG